MNSRLFRSRINEKKSKLEISVAWHADLSVSLEKQIIAIHVASFLDLHKDHYVEQLGLEAGTDKERWITDMIVEDLVEVKKGNMNLATAYIQDTLVGFAICKPVQPRFEDFKVDVYISLLAVKPLRYLNDATKKIHIGLGRALIESVMARFTDANTMTLDTWLVNGPGLAFYRSLGFSTTGRQTFGGNDPDYYTGCEKSIMRSLL